MHSQDRFDADVRKLFRQVLGRQMELADQAENASARTFGERAFDRFCKESIAIEKVDAFVRAPIDPDERITPFSAQSEDRFERRK